MTRSPCLREQWFIEDGSQALAGLCPACRDKFQQEISLFGATVSFALSSIYRLSRAIRAQHVMAGALQKASKTDDWEALRVMRVISALVHMGTILWLDQIEAKMGEV